MPQDLIKRFESDPDWQLVRAHILNTIDSLNTVKDIDYSDKEAAAIEGRARLLAIEKLEAILAVFTAVDASTDNPQLTKAQQTGLA